jgi:hypothetical protein
VEALSGSLSPTVVKVKLLGGCAGSLIDRCRKPGQGLARSGRLPQTTAWQRDQLSKCTALCNLAKILVVDRRSHLEYVREKADNGRDRVSSQRRQGRRTSHPATEHWAACNSAGQLQAASFSKVAPPLSTPPTRFD